MSAVQRLLGHPAAPPECIWTIGSTGIKLLTSWLNVYHETTRTNKFQLKKMFIEAKCNNFSFKVNFIDDFKSPGKREFHFLDPSNPSCHQNLMKESLRDAKNPFSLSPDAYIKMHFKSWRKKPSLSVSHPPQWLNIMEWALHQVFWWSNTPRHKFLASPFCPCWQQQCSVALVFRS